MKKNIFPLIIGAAAVYYLMTYQNTPAGPVASSLTDDQKRNALKVWQQTNFPGQNTVYFNDIIDNIAPSELDTVYTYVFQYLSKGIKPVPGTDIYIKMQAFSTYYNLFPLT